MMSRRIVAVIGMTALLSLTACASDPGTSPGGATPASTVAPSDAPTDAPSAPPAGSSGCTPTTDAVTVVAGMEDIAFQPTVVDARVGEVIGWTNSDSASHTATLTDDPSCTTATLARGETGALVFTAPGSYPFFCRIHPTSMTGTIEISE
jgi:plastocyanin